MTASVERTDERVWIEGVKGFNTGIIIGYGDAAYAHWLKWLRDHDRAAVAAFETEIKSLTVGGGRRRPSESAQFLCWTVTVPKARIAA